MMPDNPPAITATSDELIVWIESYAGTQDSSQLAAAVQKAHDRQQRNLAYYRAQYCGDEAKLYEFHPEFHPQEHTGNSQTRFDPVTVRPQDLTSFLDYYGISVDIVDRVGLSAAARLAAKREFAAAMRLVHNHGANVDNVAFGAVLAGDQGMAWRLFDKYDASLKVIGYGAGWINDADFIDSLVQRCCSSSGEDVSVCTAKVNSIFTGAIHGAAFMGHEQLLADLWQRHKPQMDDLSVQNTWRGRDIGDDSLARERAKAGDLSAINSASDAKRVATEGFAALGDFQLIKQMGWLEVTNRFGAIDRFKSIDRLKSIIYRAASLGRYALIHDLLAYVQAYWPEETTARDIATDSILVVGGNLNQVLYLAMCYLDNIYYIGSSQDKNRAFHTAWNLNRDSNWHLLYKLNQWCGQNYLAHCGGMMTVDAYRGKERPDIIKQIADPSSKDVRLFNKHLNIYVNGFKQIPCFFGIVNDRILRQRFLAHYPEHNITDHNISWASKIKHQFKQCFYPDNTVSYQHPFSNAQIRQIKMIDRLHQAYGFSTDESLFFMYNCCNQRLSLVARFQNLYKPLSDCNQPLSLVAWFQSLYKPLNEGRYDRKRRLFPEGKQPLPWPFEVQVHILSFCMASPWPWQTDDMLIYHLGDKLRQRLSPKLPIEQTTSSESTSLATASADEGSPLVKREPGATANRKGLGQLLWELMRRIFFTTAPAPAKLEQERASSITELSASEHQDASSQPTSESVSESHSSAKSLSQGSSASSTTELAPDSTVTGDVVANHSTASSVQNYAAWWQAQSDADDQANELRQSPAPDKTQR